jgi:para-nitrobenzyl esterase
LLPPRLRLRDPELYDFWISVRSRAWKLRGVDEPLAALAKTGNSSLFAYRFDWDDQESSFFADFPRIIGAAHGIDIAFVTGAYNYGPISSYVYPEGDSREEMRELMMTAWAGFARTGRPQLPIDWLPFSPAEREFVHLDVGDALRAARDSTTMAGLLNEVGRSNLVSELELCLLVWETLTRVGEPDYQAYDSWSQGQCSEVDATAEQAAINAALTAEHGSTSVM